MTVAALNPRPLTDRQTEQRILDRIDELLGRKTAESRFKAAVVAICRKQAS